MCVCMYVCMYMHVCIHTSVYVHAHTTWTLTLHTPHALPTHAHAHTHTHTHTHRGCQKERAGGEGGERAGTYSQKLADRDLI